MCLSNKIIGKISKNGMLEIISFAYYETKNNKKRRIYNIKCKCGNVVQRVSDIVNVQKSCGCLLKIYQKEEFGKIAKSRTNDKSQINRLISDYRNRSKLKNLQFELNIEEFEKFILDNCFYCGTKPLKNISNRKNFKNHEFNKELIYNGIDRIDSSNGYTLNNVVTCCYICNYAKRNLKINEFYQWLDNIAKFRMNKNDKS